MIPRLLAGLLVGGGLGFGWYQLVGCSTGACPLTSHPFVSTLVGMILGGLMATGFR